ncbi:hypothetical protein DSO57_1003202 [Entomophthora muscae]|uniref:Uncharacterized protein n=1 Tax=Entomophthora muscae TaxID=34485 RepID=A0ACC2RZF0_9FUNG|nr:hypothetical protein DSO57_1003202 [Entomophthora muscae]
MIRSYTGNSGHTTVDLKVKQGKLSKHALKVGDAVLLVPQRQGLVEEFCGILSSITDDGLVVGLDDMFLALDEVSTEWKIYKDENKVVYRWMLSVLREMEIFLTNPGSGAWSWPGDTNLIKQLLPPFIKKEVATKPLVRFPSDDVNLNHSQEQAIDNCLSAQASIIYGPPGTGKTQTLVELVKQLTLNGAKVLACGPSNTSVDNLLERLSKCLIRSLRVGNPDRFKLERLQEFSLETKLREYPSIQAIRSQMDELRKQINLKDANQETEQLYTELQQHKASLESEEKTAMHMILKQHNVIFSTLSGTGSTLFKEISFDN